MLEDLLERVEEWMKRWSAFLLSTIVLVMVFGTAENSISRSFQKCVSEESGANAAKSANEQRGSVVLLINSQAVCTLRLIDAHNGFFSSFAAFVIACFTITLW